MALAFLERRATANPWPSCVVEQANLSLYTGEEKKIFVRSGTYHKSVMTNPLVPTLKHFVALKISAVAQVENVFTATDEASKTMYVYTIVDDFDASVRSRIYEKEQEIIDEFGMFDFDFHIIARMGNSLADCVSEPSIELTYQR